MLRRKADNRSLLDALLRMQQDDELLVKEAEMQAARVVCSLAIANPDALGGVPALTAACSRTLCLFLLR